MRSPSPSPPQPVTGFVVWFTGLPASGKSTLASLVSAALTRRGLRVARLESDALRQQLAADAPEAYDSASRERFYGAIISRAVELSSAGEAVLIDATAASRAWRDEARQRITHFAEVWVSTSATVCEARDPKGLYRRARLGEVQSLPGIQTPYERPLAPELTFDLGAIPASDAARECVDWLENQGWLGAAMRP